MTSTFKIESHLVRFENSIFGKEKIFVNEKEKSSKYSIAGIKHNFKIGNEVFSVNSKYHIFDNLLFTWKYLVTIF